jgi:hypothetical protein
MKSHLTWNTIQKLERSFHQPTQPKQNWKTELNELWKRAIAYFAASDEPHVWQSQNQQGETVWNAHDPRTGRSVNDLSASELRVWLEERHYQTSVG